MEKVTEDMSLIARETKTETVSMKIITLVTLFFLPGTFVAVSILLLLYLVSSPRCNNSYPIKPRLIHPDYSFISANDDQKSSEKVTLLKR